MGGRPLGEERIQAMLEALTEQPDTVDGLVDRLGWPSGTVRAGVNWLRQQGMVLPTSREVDSGRKIWSPA